MKAIAWKSQISRHGWSRDGDWGLRGLETLLQLLQSDRNGYYLPGIRIQDQPRFAWRGLLIDIGRHYERRRFSSAISTQMRGQAQRFPLAPYRRPRVSCRE